MTFNGNKRETPPTSQQVEVSVFGPGFGECVVLHFGNGDWGIVDSCIDPFSKRPAALHYLESLNVDVSKSVRFVVATHWHDDHMHGINTVFQAAKSAALICSGAVGQSEFNEVLSSWSGTQFQPGGSGIDELHDLMAELKTRNRRINFPAPILATGNKVLWKRTEQTPALLRALSPSNSAVIAAMAQLKSFTPNRSKMRRRIPDVGPNDVSVVLAAEVGQHSVLLGADLEVREDTSLGWKAVVNEVINESVKHQGFKVPHHGSHTADHDEVWAQMLVVKPWATTTPFVRGSRKLPSVEDCRRILNRTPNSYLTAPPSSAKFRDQNRTVEKTVNEVALSVHFVPGKYGHVRMRKDIAATTDSVWNVELFGNAMTMDNYVKQMNP